MKQSTNRIASPEEWWRALRSNSRDAPPELLVLLSFTLFVSLFSLLLALTYLLGWVSPEVYGTLRLYLGEFTPDTYLFVACMTVHLLATRHGIGRHIMAFLLVMAIALEWAHYVYQRNPFQPHPSALQTLVVCLASAMLLVLLYTPRVRAFAENKGLSW